MRSRMMMAAAVLLLAATVFGGMAAAETIEGSVSTNGSTSMEKVIGILAESFMEQNGDVTVTYDATGSGTGIEAAANGTCDIGLASRGLKDSEKDKGLVATTLALDGIAIIVSESCPVGDISVEQIADVFTGETVSWAAFGGSGEIACIGREAGSGTRDGFESITKTNDRCRLAQELTSTGAVIAAVQSSTGAIGYASLASAVGQRGIKVLTVNGVACTTENIRNGSYVIQRPFDLITRPIDELGAAARAFFAYATSAEAAELIVKAGAVPAAR